MKNTKQLTKQIIIKNPRLTLMGNKMITQIELFRGASNEQTKRLIEKALLNKSIIADIEIKEDIKSIRHINEEKAAQEIIDEINLEEDK